MTSTTNTTYEYRMLHHPTAEDLNRHGTEGFRVSEVVLDARDGELVVFMERATEAVLVVETISGDGEANPTGTGAKGRRR